MDVTLLYFDGCPNHHNAEAQLVGLLDELGWGGSVSKINVDSVGSAESLGFRGSPTVLINGVDPFADADAPVGLTCRIYPTEDGFQGTPPTSELRSLLRVAMEST